jgi:hypothetical protein
LFNGACVAKKANPKSGIDPAKVSRSNNESHLKNMIRKTNFSEPYLSDFMTFTLL